MEFGDRERTMGEGVQKPHNGLQDAAQPISGGKLDQAERELQSALRPGLNDFRVLDLLGAVRIFQHCEPQAEEHSLS
jgi:hypothetical protein